MSDKSLPPMHDICRIETTAAGTAYVGWATVCFHHGISMIMVANTKADLQTLCEEHTPPMPFNPDHAQCVWVFRADHDVEDFRVREMPKGD